MPVHPYAGFAAAFGTVGLWFSSGLLPAVQTNIEQTSPLVWVMIGISIAGAVITYGFLTYAIARFRDPATRHRRYG